MGVPSNFPRLIIIIFGALVCLLANIEVASALQSNWPEGGVRNDRRELAADGTYSFAYTGAFQTWYWFIFLFVIYALHFVSVS